MVLEPTLLLWGLALLVLIVAATIRRSSAARWLGFTRSAQLELGGRAQRMIQETRAALRRAELDLGTVRETFGDAEAAELAGALEAARRVLDGADELAARIDDTAEETTAERRELLDQVAAACTSARAQVDAQVARIAELRAVVAGPEAAILATATAITTQAAAIDAAVTAIEDLRTRGVAPTGQGAAATPAQALEALVAAQADLERAQAAATPAAAAIHVRSANAAIARSRELTGTIDAQVARLATSSERIARLHADAQAAIDAAAQQLAGSASGSSGADPAAHEREVAADRLTTARMRLAAADAARLATPEEVDVVIGHLTAAITSAGAAAAALSSVASSRAEAERSYASAAALAEASIAQGEAWLDEGRGPAWDDPRIRASIGSARTLLGEAARVAPSDPVHAATMAWAAQRSAVQASAGLDPDHVDAPPSHEGHSPEREALEQVASETVDVVRQMLFELGTDGVESISHGRDGSLTRMLDAAGGDVTRDDPDDERR